MEMNTKQSNDKIKTQSFSSDTICKLKDHFQTRLGKAYQQPHIDKKLTQYISKFSYLHKTNPQLNEQLQFMLQVSNSNQTLISIIYNTSQKYKDHNQQNLFYINFKENLRQKDFDKFVGFSDWNHVGSVSVQSRLKGGSFWKLESCSRNFRNLKSLSLNKTWLFQNFVGGNFKNILGKENQQSGQNLSKVVPGRWFSLLSLNLCQNRLENIQFLCFIGVPQLQQLDISNNHIIDFRPLAKLNWPQLTVLLINGNNCKQIKQLNRIKTSKRMNKFHQKMYFDSFDIQTEDLGVYVKGQAQKITMLQYQSCSRIRQAKTVRILRKKIYEF